MQALTAISQRLGVIIATAKGDDLGPEGHHLRWFFPPSRGFPANGCETYRIPYDRWRGVLHDSYLLSEADLRAGDGRRSPDSELGVRNWSGRDRRLGVHRSLDLVFRQQTELQSHSGALWLVEPGGAGNLLLQFKTPVIYVRIEMSVPSGSARTRPHLTAYHGSARLAEVPFEDVIELEQPGVTDLLLPLAFSQIKRIVFVRESDVIKAVRSGAIGDQVHTVELPRSKEDAYGLLERDVAAGIANRMLKTHSMDEARDRYGANDVSQVVQYLNASVNAPDVTVPARGVEGQAPFPVRVLDHLNLAALDPNIARMLASYWVDRTPGEFLYMVGANYSDGKESPVCGFGFTRHAASAPEIGKPVTARQLPGIDYRDAIPHGRIALIWDRESGDYRNPAKPIFVDVNRTLDGVEEKLTGENPHLIGSRSKYCFRDSPPSRTKVRYQVRPLDIFGRRGPGVETGAVLVRDLEAPVPPKRIRAIVEQKGFPWQQPAQRKEPDIRGAALAATAEFGEAQRRASPDAKYIRWRWRTGPLPDGASDPATWREIATEKLTPPLEAKVTWRHDDDLTWFELPVKDVRPVGTRESQRISERIAPTLTDAADLAPDATHVDSGLLELLIDRPLLEPGLFDGYRIVNDQGSVEVMGTHAGIAASDDDEYLRRAARLVVEANPAANAVQPGDTILLENPLTEEAAPLVRVTLQAPLGSEQARAAGGEVAIDYHYVAIPETDGPEVTVSPVDAAEESEYKKRGVIVGRLVSDAQEVDSTTSFILRLKPTDFARVMLINGLDDDISTTARFHAPNVLPPTTIGLNGAAGDIEITMPLSKRYATLYLSATSVDAGGKESTQVAAPFAMRVVNPPPVVTPAAPYLLGEISTPDRHGLSTVHVAWEAISPPGASADGVRYELARALDRSIIASERDRWGRGDDLNNYDELGITVKPVISGELQPEITIDHARGTFQVKVKNPDQELLDRLVGLRGRICITHTCANPEDRSSCEVQEYHRLLKAVASGDDELEVTLLCQPFRELEELLGEMADDAGFTAWAEPDYSGVLGDEGRLRQLADVRYTGGDLEGEGRNESAFGVVSGVPIAAGTDFVDTIPGIGRSRFFYKVRAVFPGEVRSAWSPASAAFQQIDLAPADAPEVVQVRRGTTATTVTLVRPDGPGVRGIRVFSTPAGATPTEVATYALEPQDGELPLAPAPLRPAGKLIDLRLVLREARARLGVEPKLYGIYDAAVDRNALPVDGNLLPPTDERRVREIDEIANAIVELKNARSFGEPVILQVESDSGIEWLAHIESQVEITFESPSADAELHVQMVKEISHRGSVVHLDSAMVRLGGES